MLRDLTWGLCRQRLRVSWNLQSLKRWQKQEAQFLGYLFLNIFRIQLCVANIVKASSSLFSGYSTCRNGGHRPGPSLVPGARPEPRGGVGAHGAVRHGGAVHHVRSCPPPHEYPWASWLMSVPFLWPWKWPDRKPVPTETFETNSRRWRPKSFRKDF